MRLLRAGAEGRLLAARLESVRLQNALERLGRRTLARAAATTHHGTGTSLRSRHGSNVRVSSRSHFV